MSQYQYEPELPSPGWEVVRREEVTLRDSFNAEEEGLLPELPAPVRSVTARMAGVGVLAIAAVVGSGLLT